MSSELLSKIIQLEATLEARNQQLDQLDRDCRNLQERLRDALAQVPGVMGASSNPTSREQVEGRARRAPKSGFTKQVWDIADKITSEKRAQGGHPATKAEVTAQAVAAGIKEATAQSSYSAWCHFFGVNPKDTSKPYVAKAQMSADADPDAEETPDKIVTPEMVCFAPPPPPPAYLPPAPLPQP